MRALAILAVLAAVVVGFTSGTSAQTAPPANPETKQIWEMIKGRWSQTKGTVKEQWGKLTEDDLLEIEGRRDQLIGKIQARYGISKEEAESQVGTWEQKRRM
jgi:uncharacterized protein YjbJ (UPF0337 family)